MRVAYRTDRYCTEIVTVQRHDTRYNVFVHGVELKIHETFSSEEEAVNYAKDKVSKYKG